MADTKTNQKAKDAASVTSIKKTLSKVSATAIVIPKGMPGAADIQANIERFIKKQGSTVEHLIMIIHPDPTAKGKVR